jgi:SAM-dependent methyltransferase
MPPAGLNAHERHNRAFWDADADDYQATHGRLLRDRPEAWGVWRIPERSLGTLGDVRGLDVLEYGCGAAQWSIALARRGARPVGLDLSVAQLGHARTGRAEAGVTLPLVCASGERTPFADRSFDLVFCDHGAMSFCDPAVTVPEVARLLRPGGRFVFCHSTPWGYLTYGDDDADRPTRRLRRPYFGMRTFVAAEGTADFTVPYGEWIRRFRAAGLVIDDLVELRAPAGARTTYGWDPKWARRWPGEQIWVLTRPEWPGGSAADARQQRVTRGRPADSGATR